MKKLGLGILIGVSVLVLSGIVVAQGAMTGYPTEVLPSGVEVKVPEATERSPAFLRIMAPGISSFDKNLYQLKGCKIIHELNDATALDCPAGIQIGGAFEDTVYYIMDMEANVQINADDVWNLGYTGAGVTIAVLDTGIDSDHPELSDSIAGGKGFGYATYEDDHGHGTHVSGIIAANGVDANAKGVAPNSKVWMAKVCNASGSCYSSDIAAAIEYVVKGPDGIINNGDEPAKIMSISLGGGGTSLSNCDTDYLAQKVNWAVGNGVTVAVAAGNTSGRVSSPGCASKAIAVGAVDKTDVRASWSGSGLALDIMAPGVNIYSSVIGGYASWSGTSMATPHISATVALLRQVNPALTDAQIKDALYNTAKDLGATGWDKYYGWGRVDALSAVNYVKPSEPECTIDGDCNDGLYCNGTETCSAAGVCQPGILVDCSALGDQCNNGVCDEATDSCVVQPKTDGTACDDGTYCNGVETCQAGVCTGGATRICDDGKTCTIDSCNEDKDMCEYLWPTCGISDSCCGPECSSANDPDCAVAVKCWSSGYGYLYRNNGQASKFCKCASGIYGYKSYTSKILKSTVYKYVNTVNNEIWDVTPTSSNLPVYQVTCSNGSVYPTDRDYYYPK